MSEITNMNYTDRLYEEAKDLKEKVDKLEAFMMSKEMAKIARVQASLLEMQLEAMKIYLACLNERISWVEAHYTRGI